MLILAALIAAGIALAPRRFGLEVPAFQAEPDDSDDDEDWVPPPPRQEIAI
jgi:hypothetical protein